MSWWFVGGVAYLLFGYVFCRTALDTVRRSPRRYGLHDGVAIYAAITILLLIWPAPFLSGVWVGYRRARARTR